MRDMFSINKKKLRVQDFIMIKTSFLLCLSQDSIISTKLIKPHRDSNSFPYEKASRTSSGDMSRVFRSREPAEKLLYARTSNFELERFRCLHHIHIYIYRRKSHTIIIECYQTDVLFNDKKHARTESYLSRS